MRVQLIKRQGKPGLLRCVRADGSETMAPMVVGPEHDLAHLAVETTLGLSKAFYGLVRDGMRIQDFDVAGAAKRLDLPDEAGAVEFIVSLLQMERRQGNTYDDFHAELERAVAGARRPPGVIPSLSDTQLNEIRRLLDDLMARWIATPPGGTLEVEFTV